MTCRSGTCYASPDSQCTNYGAKRCSPKDLQIIQVCGINGIWQDSQVCQLGCMNGNCKVCTPEASQCIDNMNLQICGPDGQWQTPTGCSAGYYCNGSQCIVKPEDACSNTSSKRCSPHDSNMVQICNQSGVYVDYLQCPLGCNNAMCMQCTPGTTVCSGAYAYMLCNAQGQLSDAKDCPTNTTCDNDGQCMHTPDCSAGQQNCIENTVYTCTNGHWSLLYQCPKDKECQQSNDGTAYCAQKEQKPVVPSDEPKKTDTSGLNSIALVLGGLIFGGLIVGVYFIMRHKD